MLVRICDCCKQYLSDTYAIPHGVDNVKWNACDIDLCRKCVAIIINRLLSADTITDMLSKVSKETPNKTSHILCGWIFTAREDPSLVIDFWNIFNYHKSQFERFGNQIRR